MEKLCATITEKLVKNDIIPIEDFRIYKYGFEAFFSTIIGVILTLAIGIIFNKLLWTVIFYLAFSSLRSQCGGYHASTLIKCKITFSIIIVLNILLSELTQNLNAFVAIPLVSVGLILLLKYAPSGSGDKVADIEDVKKQKIISIAVFSFWTLLSIILYFIASELFWVISWSMFSVVALMLYNCVRRDKHES